jgi:F-type H+-transporting ATPase subunit epsilon
MAKIKFQITSREKIIEEGEADMLVLPGSEGEFAILEDHVAFLTSLDYGLVRVYHGNHIVKSIFVTSGFCEVSKEAVNILVEDPISIDKLDREFVKTQIKDLQNKVDDEQDNAAFKKKLVAYKFLLSV